MPRGQRLRSRTRWSRVTSNAGDHRAAWPDDGGELVESVLSHYRSTLRDSPAAIGWLVEHGIVCADAVEAFGLGFADRSLGPSFPTGAAGRVLRDRLQRLGVMRATGHERFAGCVVVPIRDRAGRVVQCFGRRVQRPKNRGDTSPAEVVWLPPPTSAHGIWHPDGLGSPEVIVAGSVLDGLVWWSVGHRHVIAAGGPAGLPEGIGALLTQAGSSRVLLAHARTPNGEHAAAALAERLAAVKLECFRVLFSCGGDASTLAAEADDAPTLLAERLRAAVWLGQPTGRWRLRGQGERAVRSSAVEDDAPPPSRHRAAVGAPSRLGEPVASPVPPPAVSACEVVVDGGELRMTAGGLAWRVRGLDRVTGRGSLRVTVSVHRRDTDAFHLDVVDLFCARTRRQFLEVATAELGIREVEPLRRDLGRLLLACEDRVLDLQEQARQPVVAVPTMTVAEEQPALELLRDPRLLDRISEDVAALGVVGEHDNVLLTYLAATSRLLDAPLAVVIQAGSGAGKSTLTDAVLSLIPAEARLSVSAVTGQSLFYLDEAALEHKVLSVAEAQGAQRAAYALKVLTGDGELSIASTGKDTIRGALATRTYRVRGPVALFLTSTAAVLDDELANRALVLGVQDDPAQTRAVLAAQRQAQTVAGLLARHDRQAIRALHANAQRLLEPLPVVIPFAPQLSFADRRTRARRDQAKVLTLIRAVALLHQHQRPRKRTTRRGIEVVYIEATPDDLAVAHRLAAGFLGRAELADLAPQTRRLLGLLDTLVTVEADRHGCRREDIRFSRRQAREHTGWSDYALRRHLARLLELEYAVPHRAGNAFIYELLWSQDDDVDKKDGPRHSSLDGDLDALARASCGHLAGISRPLLGRV